MQRDWTNFIQSIKHRLICSAISSYKFRCRSDGLDSLRINICPKDLDQILVLFNFPSNKWSPLSRFFSLIRYFLCLLSYFKVLKDPFLSTFISQSHETHCRVLLLRDGRSSLRYGNDCFLLCSCHHLGLLIDFRLLVWFGWLVWFWLRERERDRKVAFFIYGLRNLNPDLLKKSWKRKKDLLFVTYFM